MTSTKALIATIAGVAALALFVMALIYWAIFAAPAFSFNPGAWDWTLRILVILTVAAFSVYLIASPESIGQAAVKRGNRLTANALVAAIVAIAIAIVVNVIFTNVPTVRADLTAGQQFTLSGQTNKILDELASRNINVLAEAFIDPTDSAGQQQASDLLKEYQSRSSRFRFEMVDPTKAPIKAQQYGVTRYGVVVFDDGKKREVADSVSEQQFTSALARLLQTTTRTVAFLTGHGERNVDDPGQAGYSQIKQSLQQNNYSVVSWSLITSPTLTLQNPSVLVIAEPTKPITSQEMGTIQKYVDSGGRVMVIIDPNMSADALAPLSALMKKYGVTPVQGAVLDFQSSASAQDPSVLLVRSYPANDITKEMQTDQLPTLFPLAMGFKPPTSTIGGLDTTPLIQSSAAPPASWLETSSSELQSGQVQFNAGKDIAGPVQVGLSLAAPTPVAGSPITTTTTVTGTKLVVFGDADFASNGLLQQGLPIYNTDLFNNSVSWLAGVSELVSIAPKAANQTRTMVLDQGQKNLIFTTTVLALPILVFLFGIFNWWRRR